MSRPPEARPPQWPAIAPGRFAASISTAAAPPGAIALIGVADDLGIRLNHGRPGAAAGPAAFRAALAAYGTQWDALRGAPLGAAVYDTGDIVPVPGDTIDALTATHARVESALRFLHRNYPAVVVIGGGHDLTLPAVTALADEVGGELGGVNLDAHLDVRDHPGSGMPFRELVTRGALAGPRLVEAGLSRFVHEREHLEWARAQGATLLFAGDKSNSDPQQWLDIAGRGAPASFVSIDLDVLDASVAPGVSAINPDGLSADIAAALAEAAGADGRVRQLDIMELSPPHDSAGAATARVAALLFLSFIAGYMRRSSGN